MQLNEAVPAEQAVDDALFALDDLFRQEPLLRSVCPAMRAEVMRHARGLYRALRHASRRLAVETASPPQEWDGSPGRTVMRWRSRGGGGLMLQEDGWLWLRKARGGPWERLRNVGAEEGEQCAESAPGGPWRLIQSGAFYERAGKS